MKKYAFVLIAAATVALVSCGSGSSTTETTDSTSVKIDTLSIDTTTIKADTTVKVKVDSTTAVK
jgi:uncharacterized protein YcfL